MTDFFEYKGCIHGHSKHSDGSGSYPEIIKDAQEADLDFLLMSDHMTLKGKELGYEGWHNNLLLLIGYEIQDPDDQHHYLAFGIDKILPSSQEHQAYIKEVKALNALGIAAHPFEARDTKKSLPGFPPISWQTLDYDEVQVIELWNMMSHWMEETTLNNRLYNVLHPRSFSTVPKPNLLQWWDSANIRRKVTAVGSVDVHAIKIKLLGFFPKAIFDYKIMFKSIRTHILLEKPLNQKNGLQETANIIYDALHYGNCFIANSRRGDATGFRFWMETDGKTLNMGDEIRSTGAKLFVKVPEVALIKVIRNGEMYHIAGDNDLVIDVEPGSYRVEVLKNRRGWIYSNHIKIKGLE